METNTLVTMVVFAALAELCAVAAFYGYREFRRRRSVAPKQDVHHAVTEQPERVVVFLDFDGVAHPRKTGTFELLPLLEEWLRQHPMADVVISSTWRMEHSLKWLRDCFLDATLHNRVVGITPELDKGQAHVRQSEVGMWFSDNSSRYSAFAVLDDEASLFQPGWEHLVLTQSDEGLSPRHLEQLSRKLGL